MAFTLEFLFKSAMDRPDLYLPLIQERYTAMENRLESTQIELSDTKLKLYDEKDRFFKLKESAELSMALMAKLIKESI